MRLEGIEEEVAHDTVALLGLQECGFRPYRLVAQIKEQIVQVTQVLRHGADDLETLVIGAIG